jgi:micrococcal nuclease
VVPARVAVALTVVAVVSAGGWWIGEQRRTANPQARVIEVLDGDTVVVAFADGSTDTVRLLGIDTPETHHPTKGVECFGPEAAAFSARRLTGRLVRLEGDVEARDIYGRRLAHVLVDGERFNDVLLDAGYARLLVIAPNVAHARDGLAAELGARRAGRGLWSECDAGD